MGKSFWDRVAGVYDLSESLNARAYRGMTQAAARWVSPGSRVMDCAAGTGALTLAAAERAGYVLCTDLSPAMLNKARQKAEAQGATHVEFAQRDLFAPPPQRPFDAVIAGNVLHLLEDPRQAVQALLRCVHPGGRVILPTFLLGETAAYFRPLLRAYRMLGFRSMHNFTLISYRSLLTGCGGRLWLTKIPGRIPVGLGVLTRAG